MQATGTMTLTAGTPSMGLVVSMSMSGAVVTMDADANLRLTIGMSASGTLEFSGSCNMAMIVPLGNATGAMSLSGAADLRGNLSMSAEWGGYTDPTAILLDRILTLLEADEYHTATQVLKKAKGTSTVVLTKNWTGTPLSTFEAVE